MKGISKQLIKF